VFAAGGSDQDLLIRNGDTVWVGDGMPAGAIPAGISEDWNWVSSGPNPFSGAVAHRSAIVSGVHHHMFSAASDRLAINTGDVLIAYVYLDPYLFASKFDKLNLHNQGEGFQNERFT
jgi:hypothetical protein